jgi:hypothetical protein
MTRGGLLLEERHGRQTVSQQYWRFPGRQWLICEGLVLARWLRRKARLFDTEQILEAKVKLEFNGVLSLSLAPLLQSRIGR